MEREDESMRPTPLILITLMASAAGCSRPALANEPSSSAMAQRMLDAMKQTSGVPGFGAAVWKDGKIIWTGSTGMRDRERNLVVTPETKFRLASVSKVVATTAAAKLAEAGRLDLERPVAELVPEVGEGWPAINVRQLAAHVSGMPHYQDVDQTRGSQRYATSREAVRIFAGRSLLGRPGDEYSYSSWGYTLIGAAIEAASGRHFVDYVTAEVTPGLSIGADFTDGPDPDASVAYEIAGNAIRRADKHDFSYTWAGGGLGATPSAIAAFGGRVLAGQIVSARNRDALFEPMMFNVGKPVSEGEYEVGLGWRIANDRDGARMAFHNGVTIGARSALVLFRDEALSASLLSNALWTSSIDQSAQMLAAPFRSMPKGLVRAACPTSAKRFAGTFNGEAVSGTAHFAIEGGLCTGTLENTGPLTNYFANGPQDGTRPMKVIGLASDGSLPRGGLVTPYGIYDLRAEGPMTFSARMGTRALKFTITD
jgi:serine beta-lactamase-like protein LACTB